MRERESVACYNVAMTSLVLFPLLMAAGPVPLIFETDISGDCDDVGALAVLHALADRGEVELLMVGVHRDETNEASAAAVDVINTYYGRGDIPIGTSHTGRSVPETRRTSSYAAVLRDEFPHDARPDGEMPNAVALYRRTLAAADDESVHIASVGGTSNLADLLASPPDKHSPLPGRELVAAKVRLLVQMAGEFPTSRTRRVEANMKIDPPGNRAIADDWPTPIVWSGFEVGLPIRTGRPLANMPRENPVRRAYELHPGGGQFNEAAEGRRLSSLEGGRPSWDQTAALVAVRGLMSGPNGTGVPLFSVRRGRVVLGEDGRHTDWHDDPDGVQTFLVVEQPPETIAEVIDSLMIRTPVE